MEESKLFEQTLDEANLGQRAEDLHKKYRKASHASNEETGFKAGYYDAPTTVFNPEITKKNRKAFIDALKAWIDKFYPGNNFEIEDGWNTVRIDFKDSEYFFSQLDKDYLKQLQDEKERLWSEYNEAGDSLVNDIKEYAHSLIGKKVYFDFNQAPGDVQGNHVLPFNWEPSFFEPHDKKTLKGGFGGSNQPRTRHGGLDDKWIGKGYTLDEIKDWKWEIVDVKPIGHPGDQEDPWEMFGLPRPQFMLYLKDPKGRTTYPSNYNGEEVPICGCSQFVDWKRSGITDPKEFEKAEKINESSIFENILDKTNA